jgi:hypothetical protein
MDRRSPLEAIWAEIHEFTERQNSSSKIRSNRRSISLTLPITLCLAIFISMGGLLWLLGGGTLWLIFKILFRDDWSVLSLRRHQTNNDELGLNRGVQRSGMPSAFHAQGKTPRMKIKRALTRKLRLLVR